MMKAFSILTERLAHIRGKKLILLASLYVMAYFVVELLVDNPIRHYNFCVFLAISGILFSWLIGGRRTMFYVAFFNIFFVVIFSKLLWNQGIIVYGGELFRARSFILLYAMTGVLFFLMLQRKSPADAVMEKHIKNAEDARLQRQNIEFMVASRKLKYDLLAQANMVKDELQLLEGTWRSKIHDIINDLPTVKERELYLNIILPFQDNIIQHLRDLERGLTFDIELLSLQALHDYLSAKLQHRDLGSSGKGLTVLEDGWSRSAAAVAVDRNKMWDIVQNVLRNSQAAIDLKRLGRLKSGASGAFSPRISLGFSIREQQALIEIGDNGGGLNPELLQKLYHEPVPSAKRRDGRSGQGTLFVKFFAERMGIAVSAVNTHALGERGLQVTIAIPISAPKKNITHKVSA